MRQLTRSQSRVLYYDTLARDYTDGIICYDLETLKTFWAKVYQRPFRIVFRSPDPQVDFPEVCKLVTACSDLWFVIEECDLYFRGGDTCPEFKNIIQRGRHDRIELVTVTQRPKGFGRLLTSQVEEFYVFRCTEPVDLDYYRDRLGAEIAEQLPNLEQYHYLHYNEKTRETQVIKDPWA